MNSKAIWLSVLLAWSAPLAAQEQSAPAVEEAAFDEVLDNLRENNMTAEEIRVTDEFERLEIVDLEGLSADQILALNEVLDQTEDGFAEVQTAIETNALLDLKLQQRQVELLRVFAASRSDGVITVYLR